MAAVVTPIHRHQPLGRLALASLPLDGAPGRTPGAAPSGRPNLVVIDGGRSTAAARRRAVYRRRRLVVGFAFVGVLVLAAQVGPGFVSALTTPPEAAVTPELTISGPTYVVQPGDTLWEVAAALDVGGDVRDVVDRLAEVNGVDALVVGQTVQVPTDLLAS